MLDQIRAVLAEAFARLQVVIAADLPGVVAMLIVILGAVLLGAALRVALRAGLSRIGFDRRAREWGLTSGMELEPSREPSRLVAAGAFWLVAAGGVALALEVLGTSVSSFGFALLTLLPRLVIGLLVFLAGVGIARLIERNVLIALVNAGFRQARLAASAAKVVIAALASAMALQHVGVGGQLPAIGFSIVVGAFALACALAVGLGARDAVARAIDRLGRPEADGDGAEPEDRIQHL
ncbi:MAG: hypothetical protein QM704_13730 [Anaeromyxobacteraceae bacterium]